MLSLIACPFYSPLGRVRKQLDDLKQSHSSSVGKSAAEALLTGEIINYRKLEPQSLLGNLEHVWELFKISS